MFDWKADLNHALSGREMFHHAGHFSVSFLVSMLANEVGAPLPAGLAFIIALAATKEWLDALVAKLRSKPIFVLDSVLDFSGWLAGFWLARAVA